MTPSLQRPRAVGINHVALEVDDVEHALDFYGRLFEVRNVSRTRSGAFLDLGDQFIAMFEGGIEERHFGFVVDDKEAARRVLAAEAVELLPGGRTDFRDPFGNMIQVVQYDQIQFLKQEAVLRGMGLGSLTKGEAALAELRAKGLA
jgi:predicted enzyme related to lactoylglutathione lyase